MNPKFSPTRSAELLALEKLATVSGWYAEGSFSLKGMPVPDRQFIIAAPDLATELRIAAEVIKRQTPYMRHRNDAEVFCERLKHSDYPCTCGLSEALSLVGE